MRKVLIVDKPRAALLLALLVERGFGWSPVVAYDQESALEALPSFNYSLIISDSLSLYPYLTDEQGGDRWRWFDRLRRRLDQLHYTVPLIGMGGDNLVWYRDFAGHGLQGFIARPFDPYLTCKTIRQLAVA